MSSTISGKITDDVGSIAALRVALQTLAERCERLQSRLDIVEKENVTIKSHCICQMVNSQSSQINIQELSCKKQQLVEYLRIVTNENRTLWTTLTSLDNPAVQSNDKIKPKNSIAIIDNYLKYNGMSKQYILLTIKITLITYILICCRSYYSLGIDILKKKLYSVIIL